MCYNASMFFLNMCIASPFFLLLIVSNFNINWNKVAVCKIFFKKIFHAYMCINRFCVHIGNTLSWL